MTKKLYDEKITKATDWGGDESTGGLPVSGRRVQEYIKGELGRRAGGFHYDTANNRYLVFADGESRDRYLENPDLKDLLLGAFDAPFNYSAKIELLTPMYNAVQAGSKGNRVEFSFDTQNKQGQSMGENVLCTYTIRRGTYKQTVTEPDGTVTPFEISAFRRWAIMNGFDDIGITLSTRQDKIRAFEDKRLAEKPWLAKMLNQ
mgnify:CR=1 FL=1